VSPFVSWKLTASGKPARRLPGGAIGVTVTMSIAALTGKAEDAPDASPNA
jgi:hypothetical protein